MKRKAIIIASTPRIGEGHHLKGVRKDVEIYYNYLLSQTGGCWNKSEIEVYFNSNSKDVREGLRNLEADYTVTLFTGHGGSLNSGISNMLFFITDTETIGLSDLFNKSKKQLIIIDTCRTLIEDKINKAEEEDFGFLYTQGFKEQARCLYNKQIENSDNGVVILTSCSQDEISLEDGDGSYFLKSLIKAGIDYSFGSVSNPILDIKQAFQKSSIHLGFLPTKQNPELTAGKVFTWFPFAVNSCTFL